MKAGDVILIRSKGVSSLLNRAGQTIVSGRIAPHSHVLLFVAPGVIIDSTTKHGVMLRNVVTEVIAERLTAEMCEAGTVLVMRPPAGKWDPTRGKALVTAMVHVGKHYNWKFGVPHVSDAKPATTEANSAFCSELVALLLKTWKLLDATASRTWPVTLQSLLKKGAWTDVTLEWTDDLRQIGQSAKSEDKQKCTDLGLQLYQGNQQIHLINSLKQVGDALPGTDWDAMIALAFQDRDE